MEDAEERKCFGLRGFLPRSEQSARCDGLGMGRRKQGRACESSIMMLRLGRARSRMESPEGMKVWQLHGSMASGTATKYVQKERETKGKGLLTRSRGNKIRVKQYVSTIKQRLDVRILGELTISR